MAMNMIQYTWLLPYEKRHTSVYAKKNRNVEVKSTRLTSPLCTRSVGHLSFDASELADTNPCAAARLMISA